MPTSGKTRGGALLAVLWLSAALAAIAFSVSTSVRSETDRVASAADGLRTWYLATGSVERGIQWMIWGPDYAPKYWQPTMPRVYMSYASGDVVVEMIPEAAKLNINQASREDLERVITVVSGDPRRASDIADAIIDWRGGSAGTPSLFDQYYFTIAPTFRGRHASFEEIEELLLLRGMTPELFYGNYVPDAQGRLYASGGLRDCLSVWGGNGPFDINTASPALMEAMGMAPDAATAVVTRRQAQPFHSLLEVTDLGFTAPRMGVGGIAIWTLRSTARLRRPDGNPSEFVRTASATIKMLDRRQFAAMPVHVLRWYDDAWSQSMLAPPGAPSATHP